MGSSSENNAATKDAIIAIRLAYQNDLESEQKALEEARKKVIEFAANTTNKTGWIYKRGLEKRVADVNNALKNIYNLEIKMETELAAKKRSVSVNGTLETMRQQEEIIKNSGVTTHKTIMGDISLLYADELKQQSLKLNRAIRLEQQAGKTGVEILRKSLNEKESDLAISLKKRSELEQKYAATQRSKSAGVNSNSSSEQQKKDLDTERIAREKIANDRIAETKRVAKEQELAAQKEAEIEKKIAKESASTRAKIAQKEAAIKKRLIKEEGDAYRRIYKEEDTAYKRIEERKASLSKREYNEEIKNAKAAANAKLDIAEKTANRKRSIVKKTAYDEVKEEERAAKKASDNRIREEKKAASVGIRGYVSRWKSAFSTLTRYASSYMLINLGVQAFKEVAKEILNVQANLAKVRAISGATNADISKLKDTIWEISAAFGQSATDVSKFTIQMAKLGKSADEIENISVESARLSSILGEDMAQSGTLLVTVMNQFGLSTKEAGRVASTFFDTIASSPADVDGLRTAMQYVGVTARNVGLTIEQTGRLIGFLANNGIKMSKVGTGLRNVLSKIAQKGGDLNDVLDEMHENGLSTIDAFSEFGKRGGNAALLIVNHWNEVKKLMNEDMPMAAERMLKSAQAMDSTMGFFNRTWKTFISTFSSGNSYESNMKTDFLISLSRELENVGISSKQVNNDIINLAKNYKNLNELRMVLMDKYFKEQDKKTPYYDGTVYDMEMGLDLIIKATLDEQRSNKAFDDVRSQIKDFMQEKLNDIQETRSDFGGELADLPAPEDGVQTIPWGIAPKPVNYVNKIPYSTQLDRFTQILMNELPSIDPKDARKIVKEALSNATTTLRTSVKYTVEEYAEQIKKIQKENADILATGETNQSDIATIEENDNAIKDLMGIICRMSPMYSGCPEAKKLAKKKDSTVRDAINEYERWYKETKAKIRAAYAEAISKESKINEVTLDNKRNPLSLTDYMTKMGFDPNKHSFKDKDEFLNKYEEYASNFLTKLSVRIHSTADKAKELALTTYQDNKKAIDTQITNLESLLPKIDASKNTDAQKDTDRQNVYNKISAKQVELTNLKKDYDVVVNKTNKDEEAGIKRLLVLLEKLGLLKKKSQEDLEKESLVAKKDLIVQALNEAYNAYKLFNDAILQNTTDRLNAETEAIDAHYNEANDILKAQQENQLITEGQYAKRRKALEKKKIDEENRVKKAQFDAKKKNDVEGAIVNAAVQAASAAIKDVGEAGAWGIPLIAVTTASIGIELAAQLAAISSRKFYPTQYATGGWINGDSHANGGVPISIKGGSQIEAEGGEMIINKNAAARNASLLESINSGNDLTGQLKTALESARIRAFFTDKDLDAAERSRTFDSNAANYMN